MRSAQRHLFLLIAGASLVVMASQTYVRAQAKPAAGGGYNLTKEVMDKKGAIVWKTVPATGLASDLSFSEKRTSKPTVATLAFVKSSTSVAIFRRGQGHCPNRWIDSSSIATTAVREAARSGGHCC